MPIEAAEAKRAGKMDGAKQALLVEFREKAAQLGMPLEALIGRLPADAPEARTRKRRSAAGRPRVAKYRDPQSGTTWSGRGREPRWLKGKDRRAFAVRD